VVAQGDDGARETLNRRSTDGGCVPVAEAQSHASLTATGQGAGTGDVVLRLSAGELLNVRDKCTDVSAQRADDRGQFIGGERTGILGEKGP
jgi:hypothetical protein